jgi:TRAP-type uncharacterized transport system substrate-binding protein
VVGIPSIALLLTVFYAGYRLVDPAPPRRIVLSAATPGSGYERFAEMYRARLARDGVELEILSSAGSLENLKRLRDPNSGVQAAFTTTGAARPEDAADLASLGTLFFSPVLVFHRLTPEPDRFSELSGKRISVGEQGTFVRRYAIRMLEASGAVDSQTRLVSLDNDAAVDALARAEIDAAIFPAPLDAPAVVRALATPGVRLMNVAQANALTKIVPELTHVVLPRGLLDLKKDEPRADMHLLATRNSLLVRKDLHPAAQYLLLDAMRQAHSPAGPFHRDGEFPAVAAQDLPLSPQAERFHRSGQPWLYAYVPYWVAVLLDRTILIAIPVVVALIPILRYAPAAYGWLHRRRLKRLHRELAEFEVDLSAGGDVNLLRERFANIRKRISELQMPLTFEDELYHLRAHLSAIEARLKI